MPKIKVIITYFLMRLNNTNTNDIFEGFFDRQHIIFRQTTRYNQDRYVFLTKNPKSVSKGLYLILSNCWKVLLKVWLSCKSNLKFWTLSAARVRPGHILCICIYNQCLLGDSTIWWWWIRDLRKGYSRGGRSPYHENATDDYLHSFNQTKES